MTASRRSCWRPGFHRLPPWKGPDNLTLSIRQASRTAEALLDCQDILAGGVTALWQEYLGCTRRTLEMNLAHLQELVHCRSPETLVAAQAY